MEEVVVHPEDGPSPQHGSVKSWENAVRGGTYGGGYYEPGTTRLPPLTPEEQEALEDERFYLGLLGVSGISKELLDELLKKGYTPEEVYRLWIDRTPVKAKAIELGPDRFSLDPINLPELPQQTPEWEPQPEPDPEARNAAKHVLTRVIVKLFPKPVQYLLEAGFFAYEFWQVLPQPQKEAITQIFTDASVAAAELMDDELKDWVYGFFNYKPDTGTAYVEYPGISIQTRHTPKRTVKTFEIAIPLENMQVEKPPKPAKLKTQPAMVPYLTPEIWLPELQPWPEEFPEELPEIKIEVYPAYVTTKADTQVMPATRPDWEVLPQIKPAAQMVQGRTAQMQRTQTDGVVNVKMEMAVSTPVTTRVSQGNRLRTRKEKKSRTYAASRVYRALLKVFNESYGTYDEAREFYEIFQDNSHLDANGDVVLNIEQFAYDLFMNELQDRAIGKVMGKYREALEDNPTWHALSAP